MKKKTLSAVIACLLLFLCVSSWAVVLRDHRNDVSGLEARKALANEKFEKQIYDEALTEYKACLETDPENLTAMARIAEIYQKTGQDANCIAWCERVARKDPSDLSIRLLEARSYDSMKKVSSAISVLQKAKKSADGLTPEASLWKEIDAYLLELKGRYELTYFSFSWVCPWFDLPDGTSCATVAEDNGLAVYSDHGKKQVSGTWSYLGVSADDELLFPVRENDKRFFVDNKGERRLVPDGTYTVLRGFSEGLAPAVRPASEDGKQPARAGFLDKALKEQRFEFEESYPLTNGHALVKKEGTYFVLDSSLQETAACPFTAVNADIYGRALRFGLYIGRLQQADEAAEQWALFSEDGARIGDFSADALRQPESKDGPLAFCRGGLWGFVSREGEVLIEPTYEDAYSFSKGLGAVKQDGKWGYIDREGNVIIPPTFEEALPFSKNGRAFVKNHAGYSLLTLTRYASK